MRQNKSIKLKAAFLLTVFALNTVMAFACSLGLNMGYNENHHNAEKVQPVASAHFHSHAPGTKPHHHNTPATHRHDGNAKHSHDSNHSHGNEAAAPHHMKRAAAMMMTVAQMQQSSSRQKIKNYSNHRPLI